MRNYHSRTFGFASRNFYVSFLAAQEIDRNPAKYFGDLQKEAEAQFQEVQLPAYVTAAALEHALKIDGGKLRALNPALLERCGRAGSASRATTSAAAGGRSALEQRAAGAAPGSA